MANQQGQTHKLSLPVFSGDKVKPGDADLFLENLETYAVATRFENDARCQLILQGLAGSALDWYRYQKKCDATIGTNYQTFKRKFLARFEAQIIDKTAANAIKALGQKTGEAVNAYYDRVGITLACMAKRAPLPDAALSEEQKRTHFHNYYLDQNVRQWFVNGLHADLRNEVSKTDSETAEEALKLGISAERALITAGKYKELYEPARSASKNISELEQADDEQFEEDDSQYGLNVLRGGGRGRGRARGGRGRAGRNRGGGSGRQVKTCTFCKSRGHDEATCYAKHPHLRPGNANQKAPAAAGIEELTRQVSFLMHQQAGQPQHHPGYPAMPGAGASALAASVPMDAQYFHLG